MCNICQQSTTNTFNHGWRGRFNAWFFSEASGYINHVSRFHKSRAFDGIRPGTVVEIGAGTGANFQYIAPGSRVLAVEPNEAMHRPLLENADRNNITLSLLKAPAEAIPLDDASFDEVIGTLVLCSVENPSRAVSEIHRILRPGGKYRFVEHVVAPRPSARHWLQKLLAQPWAWLFEGCRLDQSTGEIIRGAGFSKVHLELRNFNGSVFFPVNTAIWGVAIR